MHLHGRRDFYNYLEGSLCMIRNKKSFTIDSKLNIYRCYSFVDGTYFKFDSYKNLLESHFNNSLVCNELSCEIYDFCCGGCIYKNYINTGEINIVCRKNHILNMNSIIFMSEIYKGNYDEKEKNIEYKKIDL